MKLQMGIVKVEIKIPELVKAVEVFKENNHKLFEVITSEVKSSVTTCLNKLLEAEIDIFLGQADQSTNKKMEVTRENFQLKVLGVLD